MAGKNLLVDWMNSNSNIKNLGQNVQKILNKSAANMNNVQTPNLPTPTRPTAVNLQKAQQPTQTKLNNLNSTTLPTTRGITTNNPAFVNGQLINQNNSRFIGFQQPQPTTLNSTQPQAKSFSKLMNGLYTYVPSAVSQAETANLREENRYRTAENALMDLQGDIYKNQRKLTKREILLNYPEFKDKIDTIMKVQDELLPINKAGQGVDMEQFEINYPELIQPKNLQDIDELKKQTDIDNKQFQNLSKHVTKALTTDAKGYSVNGLKYLKDADILIREVEKYKKNGVVGGATDKEILDYAIKQNPELQQVYDEMNSLELSGKDKARLGKANSNVLRSMFEDVRESIRDAAYGDHFRYTQDELQEMIDAKSSEKGGMWSQIKTFSPTWVDKIKEYVTRGALDFSVPKLKDYIEKETGISIPESAMNWGKEMMIDAQIQEDEARLEERKAKYLDPVKQGYYENQSITQLLAEGDFSGAGYKMRQSVAENPSMIAEMGVMAINPAIGMAVMGSDVYMQENQEAYKELKDLGATHDEAEAGAMLVGGINAAVELFMERVLGGAERAGATAFRRLFLKNAQKELIKEMQNASTKSMIKNGVKEYINGSSVEGLEEVVQTIVSNAAKQTYDENQDLFEGVGQAFEGGFYNPMNAIGGVTNIAGGIRDNRENIKNAVYQGAYNLGQQARNVVDSTKNLVNRGEKRKQAQEDIKNKVTAKKTTKTEETGQTRSQPKKGVIGTISKGITDAGTSVYDNVVEPITDKVAEGITSTTDPQDKLFKALNPSLNVLSRKKGNYDTIRKNADRANELVIEYGRTPTNTAEYYQAIQNTKKDIWNNGIKQGLDAYKYETIDVKDIVNPVKEEMKSDLENPLESLKNDANLLIKELARLEKKQIISLEEMEDTIQKINAMLERGLPPDASQIYEKGMRKLVAQMRIQEDKMISEMPGEFRKFKKDYGALLTIEEEAQKRMIQDMKKKTGGNLYQNWGRIEGLGKMIKKGSFVEGLGQFILGESLGKVKDTNFLIKSGFEGLRGQYKGGTKKPEGVKIKKKPPTPALPDKRTDLEKGKILEIDKRTKSNREEGYKTKNAVTSEKSAVTEKKPTPKKEEVVEKKETPKAEKEIETRVETKKPEIKEEKKEEIKPEVKEELKEQPKEQPKEETKPVVKEEVKTEPKNKVTAQKTQATTKTEPKQEDKSGGNAFGLKEQKGSSRINNFTNVVKRIIDKYEGEIDNTDTINIEKEPYLPLQISKLGNELIVRHINLGYDDPAMKFQILDDGKLHVTGIKQAFMEQMMGNYNWSTDIKDTDELLHVRAVNLEDQFLDESTIDEDTGVMKEKKSESKPKAVKDTQNMEELSDALGLKHFEVKDFPGLSDSEWWYGEKNGVKIVVHTDGVNGYTVNVDRGGDLTVSKTAAITRNPTESGLIQRVDFDNVKEFIDKALTDDTLPGLVKRGGNIVKEDDGGKYIYRKVEGLPPIKQYIGEVETPKTTTEITGKKTAATEKKVEKAEPKNKITAEEPSQAYNNALLEKKGGLTFSDNNLYSNYRYEFDAGTLSMGGTRVEGKEVKYMGLAEGYTFLKNAIQNAVDNGATIANVINKDTFDYMEVHKGGDHYRIMIKDKNGEPIINSGLGVFLDKNWNDIINAQSVAKSENQNIIGKNNSLTTKNPTNDRNNETDIGKKDEGQTELSNSMSNAKANDGGRTRPVDQGAGTSGEKSVSASSNNISEHRAGLENGGSSEGVRKSIRTKGDDVITEKTVTQARDINRDCVDILEKHEFSSNPADYTKEEIETLKQYEGRGGINDKEDSKTQGALNQYYTKDNIIKAMWRLLDGYSNTDILEPSMGVGRFFMYAPEGSNLAGFEYDKIPGTIAKILYPNADIKIGDFQDNFMLGNLSMGDNYRGKKYDIVIGNPPYEERQGRQKALGEEPKISRFDDYFIKRGVDMLKPGGHLAFVTSSQFLRGADNYAKQKISENAELIDAYRIPVGAFDRTGVETDIIVLRKKEGGGDRTLLSASKWFDEHPEKILGEERDDVMGRFGPKKAVVGDLGAIDEIAKTRVGTDGLPATLKSEFTPMKEVKETKAEKPVTTKTIEAKEEKKTAPVKKFSDKDWKDWTEVKTKEDGTQETITWGKSLNGVVYKGKGGPTGRMSVGKGGVGKYQKLLNANGKIGDPTITLESDREGLNYIAGELEPNLLYASGQIPLKLEQLEKDYEGGFIDEKQYNKQKDLLEQAIPQEIEYQNIYFSPYLDWIMDFPTNEVVTTRRGGQLVDEKASVRTQFKKYIREKTDSYPNIVYKNSKGEDVTANAGRVMLDIVGKGNDFPASAKERVITLLPKEYNKFLKGPQLDTDTKARLQTEYNKKYNSYANFDYSDLGYTVDDISETFMGDKFNTSDVQARGIARILTTESMIIAHGVGQGKTIEGIIGAIASMQQGKARKALVVIPAGTKASRMQTTAQLFPNQEMVDLGSLAKGTGIRKKLVDMYGPDPRDWIQDGQLVFLEHSAIGRQISFKSDTLTELEQNLTDVMESHFEKERNIEDVKKQLDRANKDIDRAREKGASAADLEKKQKKVEELLGAIQKMGRTTENTLQDILNTYSDKGLPEDGIGKALELIDEDYDTFMNDMGEYLDHEINVGQAKIDKAKALEVAKDIFNNERAIYMEDLGIDHMTVDEAHNFRNLFNKAIQDDEDGGSYHAGMQAKEGSKQAQNLYAMSQYIMSKNGGGNVILLTATPFINDPSEMYNMLSYVGKNGMMEMGVTSMDDFYDNFVGLENKLTPTASTSGVTYKNVMIGFNNTETLVKNLLDRYIDYEGESLKIVKPRLITNVARLKMGEEQTEVENILEEQIDKNEFKDEWRGVPLMKKRKLNDKGEAKGAVLEGMQQANLNLISPYLTKYLKDKLPTLTRQEMLESSPKLQMVVDIIKRQRDMGIMRGTFIYMDQGKELHEKLKTAIEESIPGVKVGIINGDKKYADLSASEAAKLGIEPEGARARQTAKKFSDGELDVLIGGANTKEGINLQGNGYHLIEVSQPRNMNDRTQLNGRMWRQGNLSNEVLDTLLLMENSSDIYRFELMARKEARWNILEQLAAYKRGEKVEDVVVEGQLDMNEEKLALFTDPEKKARVSITMEEADLKEQQAQTKGQISTIEKLIDLMSNWKNDYGRYRKLGEGVTRMDKLYDENQKAVTTDILADNALEPLEQQVDYAWNEAMKQMQQFNERRTEKWTKAEMEKNVRNNSPYSYEATQWKNLRDKLQQARGERNLVIRQTDALGINTVEGLSDFILELEQQLRGINSKLEDVQNTFNDKVAMFKTQAEENKANEMDKETILKDLEEDFKHQTTLANKEELRNWIEVTKNLPKREQARNKAAVTGGKNKYSWNAKDYVGQKATFEKPKNLITSKYEGYSESNPKPEIKYIGYTPKEIIKTKDGNTLTRIGYQMQFQKMNNTLKAIKKKVVDTEEQKSYWRRDDVDEILGQNDYYNGLKTRLSNMILKFAQRYDNEIIKAYKSDNPGKTPTGPEDFYNYINNYNAVPVNMNLGTESKEGLQYSETKVEDEYVKAGAEHLFKVYNGNKNNVIATDKNRVTSGKTMAAKSYSPTIVMRFDDNGNPLRNSKNKVTTRKVENKSESKKWTPPQRYDDEGNEISESQYRKQEKYKRLLRSWNNVKNSKDYISKYNIIEKLNGLAHDIAKKYNDPNIEQMTYDIKMEFAKAEIDRLGKDIIKRDWEHTKNGQPYIVRPDGKPGVHLDFDILDYIK